MQSGLLPISDPLSEKFIVSQIFTWRRQITIVFIQGQFIIFIIIHTRKHIKAMSLFMQ